jgi:hypothetical protein
MCHHQNAEQNHNIKAANDSLKSVAMCTRFVTAVSKQTNSCLNARNAAQSLLSENGKIKIYKTVILPVVLYGCETFSHAKGRTHTEGV